MYRVGVVRGGPSEEHDISMKTGSSVIESLKRSQFKPVDIIIARNGEWLQGGKAWEPIKLLQTVDVVFNALHGSYGEDGTIQRYLDTHSIPYTGSGAFASALAMNKALTKDHVRKLDIKLAPHMFASRESAADPQNFAAATAEVFDGPYVVKPVASGSSIDANIVNNQLELGIVIEKLLNKHEQVLVEKQLHGREATVGVINNFRDQHVYVLPPIEIVPTRQFFDYDAKYDGSTEEICPGRFSQDEKDQLSNLAKAIHDELRLSQYSRSDYIITNDGIYFLEINTLPGLTEDSLMPKALDAVGIDYDSFVAHLVYDTLRHTPQT